MSNIDKIISYYKNNRSMPLGIALARESIPGFLYVNGCGRATGIGMNESTIWSGDVGIMPTIETPQTVTISSSDSNDTVSGTGARTVTVRGLSEDLVPQIEIVALDGQSEVVTTKEWSEIGSIQVLNSGSTKTNVGDVYAGDGLVTAGVPATIFSKMPAELGTGSSARIKCPKDSTMYPFKFNYYTGRNSDAQGRIVDISVLNTETTFLDLQLSEFSPVDFSDTLTPHLPGSAFEMRAGSITGTSDVSATISALIVNEVIIRRL